MNLVFACDSIWNWEAEKNFAILKEENPELVQAATMGDSVVDPETGFPSSRRTSSAGRRPSLTVRKLSEAEHTVGSYEKHTTEHK